MRVPPSSSNHPPKPPPPNTTPLGIRISTCEFSGGHKHSGYNTLLEHIRLPPKVTDTPNFVFLLSSLSFIANPHMYDSINNILLDFIAFWPLYWWNKMVCIFLACFISLSAVLWGLIPVLQVAMHHCCDFSCCAVSQGRIDPVFCSDIVGANMQ